jgi:phage minor structural protein
MVLKLYDLDHALICGLVNAKDVRIESELSTGDKTLSFLWHDTNVEIPNEYYIRTDKDEYVVKENNKSPDGFRGIVAKLNLEEIEARTWKTFAASDSTALEMANLALSDTGWTCVSDIPTEKYRSINLTKVDSYKVFERIKEAFICEIEWDSINKIVYLKEQIGEDKGTYFITGLNLKELTDSVDTYDYATEIVPYGADELEITDVNGGKNYLTNYQYSQKKKAIVWEDSSYTDATELMNDAVKKLDEISKPKKTYQAKVLDLANMQPMYNMLSYSVGDTIWLVDSESKIRDKQRITKTIEYPFEPEKNTCDISNTVLSFDEMQRKLQAASECLSNITTNNGTVKGSTVDKIDISQIIGINEYLESDLNDLKSDYIYVRKSLGAVYAAIGEADLTQAHITTLNVDTDNITLGYAKEFHADTLYGNYAKYGVVEADNITALEGYYNDLKGDYLAFKNGDFESLKGDYLSFKTGEFAQLSGDFISFKSGDFASLQANYADISTLLFGSASGNIVTSQFANTVVSLTSNATIKDAMIDTLSVSKVLAGDISTNKFRIVSDAGNLQISDNTIAISDGTQVRVQIGKDASSDYNMYVFDKSGNLMFDALGLTDSGITRPIIRDDMVSDDANIDASKINIQTLFSSLNGATETISASKILLDGQAQTMDVMFTSLTSTVNNITVGGRNLALGTSSSYTPADTGFNGAASRTVKIGVVLTDGLSVGDYVTVRGIFKYDNIVVVSGQSSRLDMSGSGNVTGWNSGAFNSSPKTSISGSGLYEFNYSFIINANHIKNVQWTVYYGLNYIQSGSIQWCKFKVERGNKATDWSPAPEDVQTQITSLGTSLSVIQGQISSKIWQQDINTATDNMTTQYSNLSQTVDGINTQVGNVRTLYDNLTIGGRNLANNTADTYTSEKVLSGGGENQVTYLSYRVLTDGLSVGDTVTVRLEYKYNNLVAASGKTMWVSVQGHGNVTGWNSGLFGSSHRYYPVGSGTYVFLYSFVIGAEHLKNQLWVAQMRHDYVQSGTIQWRRLKVERGKKYTDWSPALEDTQAQITSVTTNYSQLADKFSWLVTSGTSAASMTLSSSLYSLVAANINLTGKVTFAWLDTPTQGKLNTTTGWAYSTTTQIDGGKIYTGTITADKISVTTLEAITAKIGGFAIGANAIYNGTNSATSTTPGIYLGTDAIRAYSSPTAYTQIQNGLLKCVGAEFMGDVYATGGLYLYNNDQYGVGEEAGYTKFCYFDDAAGYFTINPSTVFNNNIICYGNVTANNLVTKGNQQAGVLNVTVSTANSVTNFTINFPSSFGAAPVISLTPRHNSAGTATVKLLTKSTSQCTGSILASNTGTFAIEWIAVAL